MATQTIEFGAPTGLTLTAKLFALGSDTVVQTASSVTEKTNDVGIYNAVFTDVPAGEYRLSATITATGVPVAKWYTSLILATATYQCHEQANVHTIGGDEVAGDGLKDIVLDGYSSTHIDLASQASVDTIKAKTDQLTFTVANQVDANALTGGGGGDATLAKQNEILGYLTGGQVDSSSPVVDPSTIELTEGDRYDGTRRPKLAWTVAKDYTGATITLTIWDTDEDGLKVVYFTGAGVVTSPTLINVTMTATFLVALEYSGCPPISQHRFDLIATAASNDETIAWGDAYIYQRSD